MNGLERLRALGARLEGIAVERATATVDGKPLWRVLLDIAGQIECEQVEAVAWVREHGGLEPIKSSLSALELLAEGIEIDTGLAFYDESSKERCVALRNEVKSRLMPEGMEWPCFDDGEPVRIGDEAPFGSDGRMVVTGIELVEGGFVLHGRDGGIERPCQTGYKVGERVKRPAPKVLDADGVEIRVGDKLYDTETGCGRTVRAINDDGTVEFDGHENRGWFGKFFTHRAPVLAADGKPLREGETVWSTEDGGPYKVDTPLNVDCYGVRLLNGRTPFRRSPDTLTHERPDSWERLEEDAGKNPFDYCKDVGHRLDTCENSEAYKSRDLVRRAKALAGRDAK